MPIKPFRPVSLVAMMLTGLLATTGGQTVAGPGLAADDAPWSEDVPAADPPEQAGELGELLYKQHCTECHSSVAHIRQNRKVRSPEQLREYIGNWSEHLELHWDSRQRKAVEMYLDLHYYDFGRDRS